MSFVDSDDGTTWWETSEVCLNCQTLITTNGKDRYCPCGYSNSAQLKMQFSFDN